MTIVADNDEPGPLHAHEVARSLRSVGAVVSVVREAEGKDASDHLAAGLDLDGFVIVAPDNAPAEVPAGPVETTAPDTRSNDAAQSDDDELHRSQLRMAERLAVQYRSRLRYAQVLGSLEWDGTRWRHERDGASMRAAVDVVKQAVHEASSGDEPDDDLAKDVRKVETYYGLRGVL